jgi:hypothetical protein
MAHGFLFSDLQNVQSGFKFPNGHVVGSSGIGRPCKFRNRHIKATNRANNLQARRETNQARANSPTTKPNWGGAVNGTPLLSFVR